MRTLVQKWGNSLALRIPRSYATEARLGQGTPVELTVVDGKLLVTPVAPPRVTLDGLLAGVTEENLHQEVSSGPAAGAEIW